MNETTLKPEINVELTEIFIIFFYLFVKRLCLFYLGLLACFQYNFFIHCWNQSAVLYLGSSRLHERNWPGTFLLRPMLASWCYKDYKLALSVTSFSSLQSILCKKVTFGIITPSRPGTFFVGRF